MKVYVSWEDVEEFINLVVDHFNRQNITGVFGLPRGGLIFAVMLSHRLHIPMLYAPIKGCIIVDDICDSGESLLHYYRNSSGVKSDYKIVTMYYKYNELGDRPDYYTLEKKNDWIVFPWEEQS